MQIKRGLLKKRMQMKRDLQKRPPDESRRFATMAACSSSDIFRYKGDVYKSSTIYMNRNRTTKETNRRVTHVRSNEFAATCVTLLFGLFCMSLLIHIYFFKYIYVSIHICTVRCNGSLLSTLLYVSFDSYIFLLIYIRIYSYLYSSLQRQPAEHAAVLCIEYRRYLYRSLQRQPTLLYSTQR